MHLLTSDPVFLFQAISDHTRLRIIRLLCENPSVEGCLCDFSVSLEEPEYKISRHLKVLRKAGVLSAVKEGRWIYHRLVEKPEHLKNLYSLIRSLPDVDGSFRQDLKLFRKVIQARENGRCRGVIEVSGSKGKSSVGTQ